MEKISLAPRRTRAAEEDHYFHFRSGSQDTRSYVPGNARGSSKTRRYLSQRLGRREEGSEPANSKETKRERSSYQAIKDETKRIELLLDERKGGQIALLTWAD